jgi:hypothetical protein
VEGAGHIDGDDGVPALHGKILDARHMLNAGVVDQNVQAAKGLDGKGHHVLDLGWLAHVGAVVGHLHAECRDLGLGAFDIAKTVEHNVCALCCEGLGNTQADAAGGAGNECSLAIQHGESFENGEGV